MTSIDQDADEAGLQNAHVFVPPDLAPNTLTDLLSHRCPPADFTAGNCAPNTVVGNAIATSPLLSQALAGQVMLVDNGGGLLPNIGLDLRGQLHLLLQGSLNADKSVTFAGLPDIPIAHFQLAFTNPPGLLIANRNLCIGAATRLPCRVHRLQRRQYRRRLTGERGRRMRRRGRRGRQVQEGEEEAPPSPRGRGQEAQEALLQEEAQEAPQVERR